MTELILTREEISALWTELSGRPFVEGSLADSFAKRLEAAVLEKVCGEPVAWQIRRAEISPMGTPIQWESCTKELYDETLQTGRYAGYENGPRCEVRALFALHRSKP
ncbi:hypothetical protein [Burkholderia arboris]|uniref:hypothetical protein n=1 Tax=Burkholderia arboris TaxID=488730 RepID=UPI001CF4DC55|nr:hypothetical protein [Burkholderia arboris]MCA8045529.1 hypothetical protein [Burkholderia arboris]